MNEWPKGTIFPFISETHRSKMEERDPVFGLLFNRNLDILEICNH